MKRYVIKNDRGEYAGRIFDRERPWTPKRSERVIWELKWFAFQRAKELGGKVYRLRRTSAKRERTQAIGYIRALAGTRLFLAASTALHTAAGGLERGEHMAWRAPKEAT